MFDTLAVAQQLAVGGVARDQAEPFLGGDGVQDGVHGKSESV